MDYKCEICSEEWRKIYLISKKDFEKTKNRIFALSYILAAIAFICVVVTAFCVAKTHKFIESFEYVEETEYQIHQDEGINTAIIDSDKSEVEIYGESNKDDKGYCESDSQKNN